ncbi:MULTISPECIES: very short patch repair endonuclease [unclassified Mesorhizobium]|uniref:very short patch repair endonuclease n=1 Tax=unclassified Mesorhizobium TaxID=325217 RepID=UPI00112CA0A9|nr:MULTISPECIES: very short patch repair endonuclease [unclassified Mesorhizobium]TPI51222.1 DNA mismatch endonuclease Vsr [Mesorhizobium sp. B3-1-1]TPJ61362.1 DNA mismatch endonuclease Vsr [Mesorhizobium sp. B2-6-7]TPJ78265.1 DNA mismatch endonuclease Vsr [Mesorhizobium sp. B2-6-3]TPJ92571.1 DNA mismatch endonuclease Vsr [Mesorhizobium sp. B2-5-10]TPK04473.1 DNA mismatch endonuclease Vsr [Mesorhizobium sp. B2-5-11]
MPDIVSPDVRSRMMAGIRGANTKPELTLRRALHAAGFRFRLHDRSLPGKPDIVLPRYHAVLFAHGCFWHGHDCHLFRMPSTRPEFWSEKIARNREVDQRANNDLSTAGWRVGIVWECSLKGRTRRDIAEVTSFCANWLRGSDPRLEIRGI